MRRAPPPDTAAMHLDARTLSAADLEAVADAVAARLARQRTGGPDPAYARIADAAAYLALSPRSVQAMIYAGRLASRMIGGRRVIPWADLRGYVRRGDDPATISPRRPAAPPDAAPPEVAE